MSRLGPRILRPPRRTGRVGGPGVVIGIGRRMASDNQKEETNDAFVSTFSWHKSSFTYHFHFQVRISACCGACLPKPSAYRGARFSLYTKSISKSLPYSIHHLLLLLLLLLIPSTPLPSLPLVGMLIWVRRRPLRAASRSLHVLP